MTCIDCMSRDNHAMACNEDTCHINDKAQWVPKPGMQMQLSVHHSASVHGHFYGIGLGPYRKIRNPFLQMGAALHAAQAMLGTHFEVWSRQPSSGCQLMVQ